MPKKNNDHCKALFLPDFCSMQMVFVLVLIAQLAAFVLALAPLDIPIAQRWSNLGMISLYIQWCTLGSAAVLCLIRPWLCHMSNIRAGLISYGMILVTVALITELAYWFVYRPGYAEMQNWHWQFLLRNVTIAALLSGPILRYFYVRNQWRLKVQAENEARLQALQSRIRPHFLFNSMNTIASLIHDQPDVAERAVEDLSDLFRASLAEGVSKITLGEELELCRHYLDIEKLRLGDRLQVKWHVEPLPVEALVPPLLLQPLLENAVYHGIEPLTEGGCICIEGERQDKTLILHIRNPLDKSRPGRISRGNRIALDNIRERLHALYGRQGRLLIDTASDYYQTTLQLPYSEPP